MKQWYLAIAFAFCLNPILFAAQPPAELSSLSDLKQTDRFLGASNTSLQNLDLRDQQERLQQMVFDTRTVWPPADRLPAGFDPKTILEESKNPGLGILGLHAKQIDGHGVRIAIIDQPLLLQHVEYADQLFGYEDQCMGLAGPQMHAPSVASIAVGKTCGVAPKARLTFFSVPMWKADNDHYCRALSHILKINEKAADADKIHVVSISDGRFAQFPHFKEWQTLVARARDSGVFIITCDQTNLRFGNCLRLPGQDPDNAASYRQGRFRSGIDQLLVPTSRTVAGFEGTDLYTYWPEGGLSWAAPYIAGVAALAHQVKPGIPPAEIERLLVSTATKTKQGPIINPVGFIDAVSKH
jgi:hypothetical protein